MNAFYSLTAFYLRLSWEFTSPDGRQRPATSGFINEAFNNERSQHGLFPYRDSLPRKLHARQRHEKISSGGIMGLNRVVRTSLHGLVSSARSVDNMTLSARTWTTSAAGDLSLPVIQKQNLVDNTWPNKMHFFLIDLAVYWNLSAVCFSFRNYMLRVSPFQCF